MSTKLQLSSYKYNVKFKDCSTKKTDEYIISFFNTIDLVWL